MINKPYNKILFYVTFFLINILVSSLVTSLILYHYIKKYFTKVIGGNNEKTLKDIQSNIFNQMSNNDFFKNQTYNDKLLAEQQENQLKDIEEMAKKLFSNLNKKDDKNNK